MFSPLLLVVFPLVGLPMAAAPLAATQDGEIPPSLAGQLPPAAWLKYDGDKNKKPGLGRRIVFVAGDEEYRSEEALPLLARSMNDLGFECYVLFSLDAKTGKVNPDEPTHIPGLEHIAGADLLVLQLRFRELKDEHMKFIVDHVEAGKPVVGIRTSTHAFFYRKQKEGPYVDWDWRSKKWPGGFGKQILGETWIRHHGHHGKEATRGQPNPKQADHPALRGVGACFGLTDVYAVTKLPDDAKVLLEGEVVAGMKEADPTLEGPKNNPMHPVAWVRTRKISEKLSQRIFAVTMGAAKDWSDADLRRLFIQASLWCLGDEAQIPAQGFKAPLLGPWEPTHFGFGGGRLGYFPEDYRFGSPWLAE